MANALTEPAYWNDWYAKMPEPESRWLNRWRMKTQARLNEPLRQLVSGMDMVDAKVLEIGCAPGDVLRAVHQLRPRFRLEGVDYSPEGAGLAQRRLRNAGIEAAIFQADFGSFCPSASYDLVISCGLIEHFRDPVAVLREHVRLAVPGGRVAVSVPNYASPVLRRLYRLVCPGLFLSHNLAIMNESALRSALERAGLVDVVTGRGSGARLNYRCDLKGVGRGIYVAAARIWNLTVAQVPVGDVLWDATLWGYGRAGDRT